MRKPLMAFLIVVCLVLALIGGALPILQGWVFFVLALYLFAIEFETGRKQVKWARGRWPVVNRWIVALRDHKWAPRRLREFEEMTDPGR